MEDGIHAIILVAKDCKELPAEIELLKKLKVSIISVLT